MTPDIAPAIAAVLVAAGVDYLVVVRGSIYSAEKTRPDFHEPPGFNIDVCRAVKAALPDTPVFLQGSVVDWGQAEWAIDEGSVRRRRDDPRPDRRPRPGHQAAIRARRNGSPVHPLQPDLPGSRCPQPDRQLCRRTLSRPRDRGPRLVRAHDASTPRRGRRRWCRRAGGSPRRRHARPPRRRSSSALRKSAASWRLPAQARRWPRGWSPSVDDSAWRSPPSTIGDTRRRRDHSMHRITAWSPRVRDRRSVHGHRHRRCSTRRGIAVGTDRAVRSDRGTDRRGAGRGARRPSDPDHAGSHRGQRVVAHGRSGAGQRSTRTVRGHTSCGGHFCAPCDPARSRSRIGSAASGEPSPARRWSTAGSDCQPTRSLRRICRRAIASHPARSTRPCSKAAELHWPSITSVTGTMSLGCNE